MKTYPMTSNERDLFPINAHLEDLQLHCRTAHEATNNDYRRNVKGWHQTNHPDCSDLPSFVPVGRPTHD